MTLYESILNPDFEELPEVVNLSGVSLEGRQFIIRNLSVDSEIFLKRDYFNKYDKNAVGVFLKDERQIGWLQQKHAAILAPEIDCGVKWSAKIEQIIVSNKLLGVLIRLYVVS